MKIEITGKMFSESKNPQHIAMILEGSIIRFETNGVNRFVAAFSLMCELPDCTSKFAADSLRHLNEASRYAWWISTWWHISINRLTDCLIHDTVSICVNSIQIFIFKEETTCPARIPQCSWRFKNWLQRQNSALLALDNLNQVADSYVTLSRFCCNKRPLSWCSNYWPRFLPAQVTSWNTKDRKSCMPLFGRMLANWFRFE